ncbi:HupE/UreJ family protein [Oceanicola granulosus]|nr:HupE/UreJ family protein [Oceanicola granulosus]
MWLMLAGGAARAHEVMPAIADMTRQGDELVFEVAANVESFLAGIDLAAVEDTDAAPEAQDYDRLRALPPEALEAQVAEFWPRMADLIEVRADGAALPLELVAVETDEVGDVELVRDTRLTFTAALPPGAESVEVGWAPRLGALVLRQQGVEAPWDGYLEPGATSPPIALAGGGQASGWGALLAYIPVGIDHIVPLGLDHILFVLGLFFLSTRLGPLLWQVSAFTLAHTITLAAAALGYVTVPASVVEPIIAASIVYVAVENILRGGQLTPWRPAVVFGFGLLHGLGFASVLGAFGLPEGSFLPALIGFNIGVELGQLAVIAVAWLICRAAMLRGGEGARGMAALYLAVGIVVLPALAVPMAGLGPEMQAAWQPLLLGAGVLFAFSAIALSVRAVGAWEMAVAMPASALIGLVGAWWVVERVFL